jgi:hypothetical protein
MPQEPATTYLYHITDLVNLANILATGGLLSDMRLAALGGPAVRIGYDNIKRRRMTETRVPCAGNRFVGEFVPFYFCPRSPMLFVVNKGRTGRPRECQRTILHLVTTVDRAIAVGNIWAYSDGNAGAAYPSFFDDIGALDNRLDWTAINERNNWGPVSTAKAAEFLVADSFPWNSILAIGCYEDAVMHQVQGQLQDAGHIPAISVKRSWYY